MRLGLVGPSEGHLENVARAAEFLLNDARVARAIYLGADDALERTVELWAQSLVGPDASDEGVWVRAQSVIEQGTSAQIDRFVQGERARLRLKALERLPEQVLRTIEMFGDRLAVLVYDKASLDEEDILSAAVLIYGKSDQLLIKQIGRRWFLTPGPLGAEAGGILVLDDSDDDLVATAYDLTGRVVRAEVLGAVRTAKLSVQD